MNQTAIDVSRYHINLVTELLKNLVKSETLPSTMEDYSITYFTSTNPAFDDGSYRESVAKIL